ncbi:MAG: glycosyltransferase [Bacillota bacterium]
MELVKTEQKNFNDYLEFLDPETISEFEALLQQLQGKKIAMVSATCYGGGVAEKLHSLVPLLNDLGLDVDWWVISGCTNQFYNVTKSFHNCLQGQEGSLEERDIEIFLHYNELNAFPMQDWHYDYFVIHDPQPAALIHYREKRAGEKWIWRCHIDTSTPNMAYWNFLYRYISRYDACIFSMPDYVKENHGLQNLTFITPSIDPLSFKNIPLTRERAQEIVGNFGIDINRPLISQISRFDPWKDPLGVLDVYRIVKKELPEVQLALVGSMAHDDPEGWDYLYRTLRKAGEDYDIKVVTNFNGITGLEVNAFQTVSDVVLQKSLREGFGLTVAEALWKGRPVIGGKVGGIKLQIEDGVNGYLVSTVEECAEKALNLLRNPMLVRQMSENGREKVRKQFLVTKNALAYLKLFAKLENRTLARNL